MLIFSWKGISKTGQICAGFDTAVNKSALLNQLVILGITPLSIKKQRIANSKKSAAIFMRRLSILLNANIHILSALEICAQAKSLKNLLPIIYKIKTELASGSDFYNALKIFPEIFNPMQLALIQAGEQSGKLAQAINALAAYLEQALHFNLQIKKALLYPAIVLSSALFITLGILFFVIPEFKMLFIDFNKNIPLSTRVIFACSDFLHSHTIGILTVIFIFPVIVLITKNINIVKKILYHITNNIPIISYFKKVHLTTHWLEIFSLTLQAGMHLVPALETANYLFNGSIYQKKFNKLIEEIKQGLALHIAVKHTLLFSNEIIHMIAIGENSGSLENMLYKATEMQQNNLKAHLDTMLQLLEPALMFFLAIIIGGIIISMYLPIFKMSSLI